MSEPAAAPVAAPSDGSLLRRFSAGDEAAATALYHRYAARLRAVAAKRCDAAGGRFDADDIVQSAFRTFFQGARRRAYTVPPDGELWGLLMVIGLNKLRAYFDHHRAEKRDLGRTTAEDEDHPALARDETAADFLRMVVEERIVGLPPAHQEMVQLRLMGYEVGEISARTGRSRRTVERVLQEFRAGLAGG